MIDFDFLDFPQDKGCAWVYSINALCILPISSQSIKRCTHGSRINKINYFTVLSTTLLSENGFVSVSGDDFFKKFNAN